MNSALRPLVIAGLTVALASAATLGLARTLQDRAAATSHELPKTERTMAAAAHSTPGQKQRGETLFLNSCAHCHGADARGDEGPDLHGLQLSDRRIATVIQRGIEGEMPSFAKKHSQPEIVALIVYLRTLE